MVEVVRTVAVYFGLISVCELALEAGNRTNLIILDIQNTNYNL